MARENEWRNLFYARDNFIILWKKIKPPKGRFLIYGSGTDVRTKKTIIFLNYLPVLNFLNVFLFQLLLSF